MRREGDSNIKKALPSKRKFVRVLIVLLSVTIATLAYLSDIHHGQWRREATKETEYECTIEGIRFKGKTGNHIDNYIYYLGGWELNELHALRDIMRSVAGDKGVFLDIGANIGTHSLYMSKNSSLVLSIEPYQPVLKRMHELIILNGIGNIRTFQVGYSNKDAIQPFFSPPERNTGKGSFDPAFSKQNNVPGNLRLVVGDRHLAKQGINHVDIIKVDIEGFERFALMGLKDTMRKSRPVVVFELNPVQGGFQSKERLLETFPEAYHFFYLELKKPKDAGDYHVLKLGPFTYTYGAYVRGDYILRPFDFTFDFNSKQDVNLVAIPYEKMGNIFGNQP